MSDFLSELITAEQAAMAEAPAAAKEATWAALEASLASGVPAPVDVLLPAAGSSALGWIGALIAGGGAALLGVWMVTLPAEPSVDPAPPPVVEVAPPVVDPAPPPVVEAASPPAAEPPPPRRRSKPRRVATKRRPRPSLSDQIAALRTAQQALAAERHAEALSAVQDHRRRFPKSPLEQERDAVEVLAACGGNRAGAARLARRFLSRWPRSPQVDRIRRTCPKHRADDDP